MTVHRLMLTVMATARSVQWMTALNGAEHVSISTLATVALVRGAQFDLRFLSSSNPSTFCSA